MLKHPVHHAQTMFSNVSPTFITHVRFVDPCRVSFLL